MKNKIIGLGLSLGICYLAVLIGGAQGLFINIPSLLIVGCMTFGLLYSNYGSEGLTFIFKPPTTKRLQIAVYGGRVAVISGWMGTLIGSVQMAANMNWSDIQAIGPAFSVSLLTVLYGHMLHLFFFMPYQYNHKATDLSANKNTDKQVSIAS